jgi:chromosome segregation ATPase
LYYTDLYVCQSTFIKKTAELESQVRKKDEEILLFEEKIRSLRTSHLNEKEDAASLIVKIDRLSEELKLKEKELKSLQSELSAAHITVSRLESQKDQAGKSKTIEKELKSKEKELETITNELEMERKRVKQLQESAVSDASQTKKEKELKKKISSLEESLRIAQQNDRVEQLESQNAEQVRIC